ncbi:MAG: signal recognition particle protein [Bdellovibrionales bacterium]|nr:signal recognition particle protein [Bdellovibrionales bacterium]
MFENLTEKILETLRTLGGKMVFTEDILDEVCRQLRKNLLEADVNVKVVKDFIESVRAKCVGIEIKKSFTPEQQFIRIVYDELAALMGGSATPLNFKVRPPAVFLVAGLQGAGKTTTVGKLAKHLKEVHKKNVMVASVDVYRPAALEQLKTVAAPLGVEHFESPVVDSARHRAVLAKDEAIRLGMDVLLLDTAGRLHIDEEMMAEIEDISSELSPAEVLLVLDAMTGQDAVQIATSFQERLPLTGIVLTKLDGDARGGAALSVRAVTGCPVKFVGMGERSADLEVFHPDRIASRILDMGDLLSLAEKAKDTLDPAESLKLARKVKKNDFTLADFYVHLQQIKKMGSFENLMRFLPGMGQLKNQLKTMSPPDTELRKIEAIILSMTPEERVNHALLNASRRRRIASGSGTRVEDINRLVKQFLEARKMMSRMAKKSGMGKRMRMW